MSGLLTRLAARGAIGGAAVQDGTVAMTAPVRPRFAVAEVDPAPEGDTARLSGLEPATSTDRSAPSPPAGSDRIGPAPASEPSVTIHATLRENAGEGSVATPSTQTPTAQDPTPWEAPPAQAPAAETIIENVTHLHADPPRDHGGAQKAEITDQSAPGEGGSTTRRPAQFAQSAQSDVTVRDRVETHDNGLCESAQDDTSAQHGPTPQSAVSGAGAPDSGDLRAGEATFAGLHIGRIDVVFEAPPSVSQAPTVTRTRIERTRGFDAFAARRMGRRR